MTWQRRPSAVSTVAALIAGLALTQTTACGCPGFHYVPRSPLQPVGVPVLLPCSSSDAGAPYVDADGLFWSTTPDSVLPSADSPGCSADLLTGREAAGAPALVYSVSFIEQINLVRTIPPQGEVAQSSPAAVGTTADPLCPNPVHLLGSAEIDFDHALWVGADGVVADCLNAIAVRLVDADHAVETIRQSVVTVLERVDSAGVPLGPAPSLPSSWTGTPVDVPCAVSGRLPYGGFQWAPAPGQAFPTGHEPDCRLDPTATLLPSGRLHVSWDGRVEDLVRHRGATLTIPCG